MRGVQLHRFWYVTSSETLISYEVGRPDIDEIKWTSVFNIKIGEACIELLFKKGYERKKPSTLLKPGIELKTRCIN